jgi:hypothetical protein
MVLFQGGVTGNLGLVGLGTNWMINHQMMYELEWVKTTQNRIQMKIKNE